MTIVWKESLQGIDWEELSALYKAAPLGNKSPDWLKSAFSNSMFRCFAYDDERLVGAGRALADGVDCSYICDVAVLPQYQGKGVGKDIISRLIAHSKGHRKIILYAVPGKEAFYKKLGFRRMTTAMAIFQDQERAAADGYITEA
jgi:ribosomal protein S18 acetylase RimI-like enzyme